MTAESRLARLGRWLALARSIRRERRALAALPPHLLCDIGLSPSAARHEAARPLWSLPHERGGGVGGGQRELV